MTNTNNQDQPTASRSTIDPTQSNDARFRRGFDTAKKCIVIFGVVSAIVLGTVVTAAATGGSVSTFMWIRASLLLAITPVLYRLAVRASQAIKPSVDRLRVVTTILPIAIIGVDLIPGVCPVWYASMQAVSALALIPVAVITRRHGVQAAHSNND